MVRHKPLTTDVATTMGHWWAVKMWHIVCGSNGSAGYSVHICIYYVCIYICMYKCVYICMCVCACWWVHDPLPTTVNRFRPFPLTTLPNANVKFRMCATIAATTNTTEMEWNGIKIVGELKRSCRRKYVKNLQLQMQRIEATTCCNRCNECMNERASALTSWPKHVST